MTDPIFVFGSNLAGKHYGGAARYAHQVHGAVMGKGTGHHGNSYAIPTCDDTIAALPLVRIKPHIDAFIDYAKAHPELEFHLTHIGCGIAGYDWNRDIRPMLPAELPKNITILEPL